MLPAVAFTPVDKLKSDQEVRTLFVCCIYCSTHAQQVVSMHEVCMHAGIDDEKAYQSLLGDMFSIIDETEVSANVLITSDATSPSYRIAHHQNIHFPALSFHL